MAFEYLEQIGKAREEVKTKPGSLFQQLVKDFAEETTEAMKEDVPKSSGALANSIGFNIKEENGQIVVEFYADDYYDFLNSGVDGVQRSAGAIPNAEGIVQSFKTLNPSPSMVEAFGGAPNYGKGGGRGNPQNWMASKGIIASDGDYNSLAYLLARATKRDGIKPSEFINNQFREEKLQAFADKLTQMISEIL